MWGMEIGKRLAEKRIWYERYCWFTEEYSVYTYGNSIYAILSEGKSIIIIMSLYWILVTTWCYAIPRKGRRRLVFYRVLFINTAVPGMHSSSSIYQDSIFADSPCRQSPVTIYSYLQSILPRNVRTTYDMYVPGMYYFSCHPTPCSMIFSIDHS